MRFAIILLTIPLLSGCLLDVLTSTAIQGELQAQQATAAKSTLDRVTNDTGQVNLQHAVDLYQADKGGYPESLSQLVPAYINPIPARADGGAFGYNPVTGRVLDDDSGPAPEDYLLMERINTAINAYGNATNYYPGSLDDLARAGYLPAPPRTAAGEQFLYDNQTGAVTHPKDGYRAPVTAAAPRPNRGMPAAGGGGPMGEAMTGIAMQQQLNSNSNAGTAAAGSRGRTGARGAAATQNARQEKALNDLGF